jgi:hypothetical protein
MKQQSEAAPTVAVPIKIRIYQVDALRAEAKRRGLRADELVEKVLTNIKDRLFSAVLDF